MKNVALANYLATGFVEVQGWCYREVAKMVDLVDGLSATEITKQDVKNEQRQQQRIKISRLWIRSRVRFTSRLPTLKLGAPSELETLNWRLQIFCARTIRRCAAELDR